MPRPRSHYRIGFIIRFRFFKPVGLPLQKKDAVVLSPEEAEALRLKHVTGLQQIDAAERLGVSQSTFQRILSSAHRKVSAALITGKTIEIADESNY